jgi:hypothetical protein
MSRSLPIFHLRWSLSVSKIASGNAATSLRFDRFSHRRNCGRFPTALVHAPPVKSALCQMAAVQSASCHIARRAEQSLKHACVSAALLNRLSSRRT